MPSDLVVFAEDWSAYHPSNSQQLMQQLMASRRVLWVNAFGLRRPRMSPQEIEHSLQRLAELPAGSAKAGLRVLAPRIVPAPAHAITRDMLQGMLERQVRTALTEMDLRYPLLWLGLPTAAGMLGVAGERALVYYRDSDPASLSDANPELLAQQERLIAARADLILVTQPQWLTEFPSNKTRLLSPGVDVELFAMPAPRPADLPTGMPIAGCHAAPPGWLASDLLAETARRLPHWCFVFIGPLDILPDRLRRLRNVRFLGPREYRELPGYLQHWDASLLPGHSPERLLECLAAGRPVVTTDPSARDGHGDLITAAETPDGLAAALESARQEGDRRVSERRSRVAGESWGRRGQALEAWLATL